MKVVFREGWISEFVPALNIRRRLGKNFLSCCSIGRVRSCVRPVCAAVKPLAIMLCAERVPIVNAHFLKCDDPNGFSRSPDRPCLHYVVMSSPIGVFTLPAAASVLCIARREP